MFKTFMQDNIFSNGGDQIFCSYSPSFFQNILFIIQRIPVLTQKHCIRDLTESILCLAYKVWCAWSSLNISVDRGAYLVSDWFWYLRIRICQYIANYSILSLGGCWGTGRGKIYITHLSCIALHGSSIAQIGQKSTKWTNCLMTLRGS